MIRVLQVVTSMDVGGIEVLLMNLYRHIDRSVLQFDFLLHRLQVTHFEKEIQELGGRIYRVPPVNPLHHHAYLKALEAFFVAHTEHKIVHAHNNAFSMYVLRAAKKAGVSVCIAHSHIADVPFDWKRSIFYNYCRIKINKYVDYAFACSNDAGKWLFGKHILNIDCFHVLHNGIICEKFRYSEMIRRDLRTKLGIGNQFVIGHIGRFSEQKNQLFILSVFSKILQSHPESLLLFVGDGKGREKIEHQAQNMNLIGKVQFLGVRSDVPNLMQAMDVFLFPSLFEGFPVTLVEAQAAGLPCVVSDTISKEVKITDLVEFVPLSKSPEEWAKIVLEKVNVTKRKDYSEEVKKAGFDVTENAKWLQEFYLARHREALEQKR